MDRASDALVRVAKALGDPTRLDLLRTIAAAGEIRCKDLVDLFPVAQATVSHHLKILTDAGLVKARREGQFGFYSLRAGALEAHAALLGTTFTARPRRRKPSTPKSTKPRRSRT